MPRPSTAIGSPRADLRDVLFEIDLELAAKGFIGHQILAPFSVPYQAGTFLKFKLESLIKERKTDRTSGGSYNRGTYEFDNDSWATAEHGWEEAVDERQKQIYVDFFDAELVALRRAVYIVASNQERRMADKLFNATTFSGQTTDITHEWDDPTNARPINDVEAAVRKVFDRTGLWPDTLTVTKKSFRNLRQCSQVLDRIASSGAGSATKAADINEQMLAEVFDLRRVLVAGGARDSAKLGQARSVTEMWNDEYALVSVTAQTEDLQEPCLGRLLHWNEDGGDLYGAVEEYWEEQSRSKIIRIRHEVQEKLLYTEAAELLTNVTTHA